MGVTTEPMCPWYPVTSTLICCSPSATRSHPGSGEELELPTRERLGIAGGRVRLHAPDAHQPEEEVVGEPVLGALGCEMRPQELGLALRALLGDREEDVARREVAVVLRDLELEDEMVPERVPGQLGGEAVILVRILAGVREDEIGRDFGLQALEDV